MLKPRSLAAQSSSNPWAQSDPKGIRARKRLRLNSSAAGVVFLVSLLCTSLTQAQEALWEQHLIPNKPVPSQLAPAAVRNGSVERAIRIVRRKTGGRVLAASASSRNGTPGVNVRTLLDGERVTTFFVQADGRLQKR